MYVCVSVYVWYIYIYIYIYVYVFAHVYGYEYASTCAFQDRKEHEENCILTETKKIMIENKNFYFVV